MQNKINEVSQTLESIRAQKDEVSANFDWTHNKVGILVKDMNDARHSIEKANMMISQAKEMINKAESLLAKTQPLHDYDSQQLEILAAEKTVLKEEEAKVLQELAQAKAQLAALTAGLNEDMKREAAMKAEEEKRRRILHFEEKLKSYVL